MSLTPEEKEEKKRRCCFSVKWDFIGALLFVFVVAACCSGVKDGNRLNKETERLRNESRP